MNVNKPMYFVLMDQNNNGYNFSRGLFVAGCRL